MSHKAGFVSLIGKPNVGKSTLMNALVGEKMSIITSKPQTTRHKIVGVVNGPDFQVVFSDTPGVMEPKYGLHQSMMNFTQSSLIAADLVLLIVDTHEKYEENHAAEMACRSSCPIALIINKIDQADETQVKACITYWEKKIPAKVILAVSALHGYNITSVMQFILGELPEHAPYYDKDVLTDRPERFFVSETIREKIFKLYQREIPYSTEVIVTSFSDEENIVRIHAEIIVERDSQKNILIGPKGQMLKKVGTYARQDMEIFLKKKIYLETHVKVIPNWRNKKNYLKTFGYEI